MSRPETEGRVLFISPYLCFLYKWSGREGLHVATRISTPYISSAPCSSTSNDLTQPAQLIKWKDDLLNMILVGLNTPSTP